MSSNWKVKSYFIFDGFDANYKTAHHDDRHAVAFSRLKIDWMTSITM
jgi:hypothetical protein